MISKILHSVFFILMICYLPSLAKGSCHFEGCKGFVEEIDDEAIDEISPDELIEEIHSMGVSEASQALDDLNALAESLRQAEPTGNGTYKIAVFIPITPALSAPQYDDDYYDEKEKNNERNRKQKNKKNG